jgi:chromosome segregation ATPase
MNHTYNTLFDKTSNDTKPSINLLRPFTDTDKEVIVNQNTETKFAILADCVHLLNLILKDDDIIELIVAYLKVNDIKWATVDEFLKRFKVSMESMGEMKETVLQDLYDQVSELESKVEEVELEKERASARAKQYADEATNMRERLAQLNSEKVNVETMYDDIKTKHDQSRIEVIKLQSRVKVLEKNKDNIIGKSDDGVRGLDKDALADLEDVKSELESTKQRLSTRMKDYEDLQKKMLQTQEELSKVQTENAAVNSKLQNLEKEKEGQESVIAKYKSKLDELKAQASSIVETEFREENLKQELESLRTQLATAAANQQKSQETISALTSENLEKSRQLAERLAELGTSTNVSEEYKKGFQEQIQTLQRTHAAEKVNLETQVADLQNRLSLVDSEVKSLNNELTKYKGVDLQQKLRAVELQNLADTQQTVKQHVETMQAESEINKAVQEEVDKAKKEKLEAMVKFQREQNDKAKELSEAAQNDALAIKEYLKEAESLDLKAKAIQKDIKKQEAIKAKVSETYAKKEVDIEVSPETKDKINAIVSELSDIEAKAKSASMRINNNKASIEALRAQISPDADEADAKMDGEIAGYLNQVTDFGMNAEVDVGKITSIIASFAELSSYIDAKVQEAIEKKQELQQEVDKVKGLIQVTLRQVIALQGLVQKVVDQSRDIQDVPPPPEYFDRPNEMHERLTAMQKRDILVDGNASVVKQNIAKLIGEYAEVEKEIVSFSKEVLSVVNMLQGKVTKNRELIKLYTKLGDDVSKVKGRLDDIANVDGIESLKEEIAKFTSKKESAITTYHGRETSLQEMTDLAASIQRSFELLEEKASHQATWKLGLKSILDDIDAFDKEWLPINLEASQMLKQLQLQDTQRFKDLQSRYKAVENLYETKIKAYEDGDYPEGTNYTTQLTSLRKELDDAMKDAIAAVNEMKLWSEQEQQRMTAMLSEIDRLDAEISTIKSKTTQIREENSKKYGSSVEIKRVLQEFETLQTAAATEKANRNQAKLSEVVSQMRGIPTALEASFNKIQKAYEQGLEEFKKIKLGLQEWFSKVHDPKIVQVNQRLSKLLTELSMEGFPASLKRFEPEIKKIQGDLEKYNDSQRAYNHALQVYPNEFETYEDLQTKLTAFKENVQDAKSKLEDLTPLIADLIRIEKEIADGAKAFYMGRIKQRIEQIKKVYQPLADYPYLQPFMKNYSTAISSVNDASSVTVENAKEIEQKITNFETEFKPVKDMHEQVLTLFSSVGTYADRQYQKGATPEEMLKGVSTIEEVREAIKSIFKNHGEHVEKNELKFDLDKQINTTNLSDLTATELKVLKLREERAKLIKSIQVANNDPTKQLTAAIVKYIDLIDSLFDVRIITNFRTQGYEKADKTPDVDAIQTATNNFSSITGGEDATNEALKFKDITNTITARNEKYGPFFRVVNNGRGIDVADDMKTMFKNGDPKEGDAYAPMHYIYSAYGYSGSGKSYTLLNNPSKDSVFNQIMKRIAEHKTNEPLKVRLIVYDLYGEIDDKMCPSENYAPEKTFRKVTFFPYDVTKKEAKQADTLEPINSQEYESKSKANMIEFEVNDRLADEVALMYEIINAYRVETNFGRDDDQEYHIRRTPNNKESSRAHLFIDAYISTPKQLVGKVTVMDMAGSENVTAIQNSYFSKQYQQMITINSVINAIKTADVKAYNYKSPIVYGNAKQFMPSKFVTAKNELPEIFKQYLLGSIKITPNNTEYRVISNQHWFNLFTQSIEISDNVLDYQDIIELIAKHNASSFLLEYLKLVQAEQLYKWFIDNKLLSNSSVKLSLTSEANDISTVLYTNFFTLPTPVPKSIKDAGERQVKDYTMEGLRSVANYIIEQYKSIIEMRNAFKTAALSNVENLIVDLSLLKRNPAEFPDYKILTINSKRKTNIDNNRERLSKVIEMVIRIKEDIETNVLAKGDQNLLNKYLATCEAIKYKYHCPIRRQGNFINDSLEHLKTFSNNLATNKLNARTGHELTDVLLKTNTDRTFSSTPLRTKFVLLTNIRLDFKAVEEDEIKQSIRDAFPLALDFAHCINPFKGEVAAGYHACATRGGMQQGGYITNIDLNGDTIGFIFYSLLMFAVSLYCTDQLQRKQVIPTHDIFVVVVFALLYSILLTVIAMAHGFSAKKLSSHVGTFYVLLALLYLPWKYNTKSPNVSVYIMFAWLISLWWTAMVA